MVGVVFGERRRPGVAWVLRRMARKAVDLLVVWHERARQRRRLQELSERMLEDLGLTRADVEREVRKPPFRP